MDRPEYDKMVTDERCEICRNLDSPECHEDPEPVLGCPKGLSFDAEPYSEVFNLLEV